MTEHEQNHNEAILEMGRYENRLRDELIIAALGGLCANAEYRSIDSETIAIWAVDLADKVIKQRG